MKSDFLVVQYETNSFLINRAQFSTSVYQEAEYPIKSPLKYFSTLTEFGGNYLLVFDFDRYLKDLFNYSADEKPRLILITDITLFEEDHQKLFTSLKLRKHNRLFSTRYVAIKVSNTTCLNSITLVDLKLVPLSLRDALGEKGVLGLRFHKPDGIQYFVDCETIMANQFQRGLLI